MDEEGRIIENSILGDNVIVKPFVHIKRSIIRNDCLIESFSNIHGSKIGERVKVLGHVFIPAGILIDHDSVICPGVIFTNESYPNKKCHGFVRDEVRYSYDWCTYVGKGVTIGAGSIIGSGIRIGDGAFIGMGSVVVHNVPAGSLVYGNPARVVKKDELAVEGPKWKNWNNDEIVDILEKDWNENMQQRRTLHEVLKELRIGCGMDSILDAGCGTGVSFPFLNNLGYYYQGVDITPKMIERAKKNYPDKKPRFTTLDILTLEGGQFDVVLNCDVLLHTPTVKPYLDKLWELTSKVLVIKLAYVWNKPTRDDFDGTFYNRKFNLNELKDMFLKLDPVPKSVKVYDVDDDEKTSPEFLNAQVFVIWKEVV